MVHRPMASWTWSIKLAIGRVGCTSDELDVARAIGICNRVLTRVDCLNCISQAAQNLTTTYCPAHREAYVHATKLLEAPNIQLQSELLNRLRQSAAAGGSKRKYAQGDSPASSPYTTFFAAVQCTPDLSEKDCNDCLNYGFRNAPKERVGIRWFCPSCSFQIESDLRFFLLESEYELDPPTDNLNNWSPEEESSTFLLSYEKAESRPTMATVSVMFNASSFNLPRPSQPPFYAGDGESSSSRENHIIAPAMTGNSVTITDDFCSTSIANFHRSCLNPDCSSDICLSCCKELREDFRNNQERDREKNAERTGQGKDSKANVPLDISNWKLNSDGSIPCPPKELGGCGTSTLELRRLIKRDWSDWMRAEPVIVRNVLEKTSGLSWEPMVMWRACREMNPNVKCKGDGKSVKVLDCLDWCQVFDGYLKGRMDPSGLARIVEVGGLASINFQGITPSLFLRYLSPKYQIEDDPTVENGLMMPTLPSTPPWEKVDSPPQPVVSTSAESIQEQKLDAPKETNGNANESSETVVHGGAVWDIFRRENVPKLTEYLKRHKHEFRHICNQPVESVIHPIHDQSMFLNESQKKQLKKEFGEILHLGEAVFIPSGCPHQVRNIQSCIKVALDFVAPESLEECLRLTQEIRRLPKDHRFSED
ncbi:hypothetical protein F2Q70_00009441 [Brassica cretica]|uniref:JmjC domain-containing protein n=1 Tax=Brassica cretica TaxID=69181 RepID=A0A8S9LV07_BRACR|nr:hypothetical protein F2Q70_00009441 [Brassica cretica]